jgi:hypothetical protein
MAITPTALCSPGERRARSSIPERTLLNVEGEKRIRLPLFTFKFSPCVHDVLVDITFGLPFGVLALQNETRSIDYGYSGGKKRFLKISLDTLMQKTLIIAPKQNQAFQSGDAIENIVLQMWLEIVKSFQCLHSLDIHLFVQGCNIERQ